MIKKILLIDDDEVTNYINKRVIQTALPGVEICVALNGSEALTIINDHLKEGKDLFDVMMVDISMPVMDGWEFIKVLSGNDYEAYHHRNIVMLTSSVFDDDIMKAKEFKVIKAFHSKPLDNDKVKDILNFATNN
jgi:CheY-like chemotaxis protein